MAKMPPPQPPEGQEAKDAPRKMTTATTQHVKRFSGWWLITVLLLILIYLIADQQLEVLAYKLLQVTLALIVGYFADRALFKYVPPVDADLTHDAFGASRMLCRAIVALAVILGLTTGL